VGTVAVEEAPAQAALGPGRAPVQALAPLRVPIEAAVVRARLRARGQALHAERVQAQEVII
jgi:hypothetical protein